MHTHTTVFRKPIDTPAFLYQTVISSIFLDFINGYGTSINPGAGGTNNFSELSPSIILEVILFLIAGEHF